MASSDMSSLDYFVGGVPAGIIFKMSLDDIRKLLRGYKRREFSVDTLNELCLIGLVSYFEAFCKNHFASIINVCPQILGNFLEKRSETTVNVRDLLKLEFVSNQIGFLLSEKYDFGSAKSVNSLYCDLILVSPFSKEEIKRYDELLNDRNLLVHHSGIYTSKYHEQRLVKSSIKGRIFFDSLVLSIEEVEDWIEFLEGIVIKTVEGSYKVLSKFIAENNLSLNEESTKALNFLKEYHP